MTKADIALSSQMSGSWAAFAKFGTPVLPKVEGMEITVPEWELATKRGAAQPANLAVLGGPGAGAKSIQDYGEDFLARRAFWNSEEVIKQRRT